MEKTLTLTAGAPFLCFSVDAPEGAPALIVIEEIWGLNEHIKDVARRFAKQGYAVLAPELLGDTGILEKISPAIFADMHDPAKRDAAQVRMREALAPMQHPGFADKTVARLKACYAHLRKTHGRIAVLGFCFGGTYAYALAAHEPGIKAAIPFYGHPPKEEDIARIACSVLAFYGERDLNLIQSLPELEASMQAHGKDFTYEVYKDTGHAFFNDTNKMMYNKEAAEDSWTRTLAFLKRNV